MASSSSNKGKSIVNKESIKRKKESNVKEDHNQKKLCKNIENVKTFTSRNNLNLSSPLKFEKIKGVNLSSQNTSEVIPPLVKPKKEKEEVVCNSSLPRRTRAKAGQLDKDSQNNHNILQPAFKTIKEKSLCKELRPPPVKPKKEKEEVVCKSPLSRRTRAKAGQLDRDSQNNKILQTSTKAIKDKGICKDRCTKKLTNITHDKNLLRTKDQPNKELVKIKKEPSSVHNYIEDCSASKDSNSVSKQNGKSKNQKSIKEKLKKSGIERSVVRKGQAAVDGLCPIASISHVYCEGKDIWDCMLNQTNIQFNNNKYYLIQLLKDDSKDTFSVWMRWGRVGCPGQNSLKPFSSNLEKAKETFRKKFNDKTKNDWELRSCFEKVPGKYDLLMMDYSNDSDMVDSLKKEENPIVQHKKIDSKLEDRVKALVELICDVRAMEEAVMEMKYDANKAPLGKLTVAQVNAGYAALKMIDDLINEHGKPSNKSLLEACNLFYTRIPHYFGMKVPPLICTKSDIQEKLSLLQALGDIQAVMNILSQPIGDGIHPADQHYNGLGCDIEPLEKISAEYMMLEKYLKTTHGSTHSMYKMEILEIFKISRSVEDGNFKDYGNRMLLWHGSRMTNWAGILSKGLRIAPPEAPSTGYMFGKGIYFADMSSKSANYCMASSLHDTGLLVLCDVSLGQWHTQINANYNANKLPPKHHSVKALGKYAPDPKNQILTSDNVIVPMGPYINTEVDKQKGFTLQYNEYIVYDVNQVKVKYLFKLKFKFN